MRIVYRASMASAADIASRRSRRGVRGCAEGSGSPTTPLEARHLLARQNPSNVLKLINGKITHRLKRNSVIQIKFHIELLSHILAASGRRTTFWREIPPFPRSNTPRTRSKSRASKSFELNSRIVKYLIAVKIPDRRLSIPALDRLDDPIL